MMFRHRWARNARDGFWTIVVATGMAVRSHARHCWAAIGVASTLAIGSNAGTGGPTIIVGTSWARTTMRGEVGAMTKWKGPSRGSRHRTLRAKCQNEESGKRHAQGARDRH